MKTITNSRLVITAIVALVMLGSCSKDRIETTLTSYESMNDYYDSKKQPEQEYVIDTNGTCPLTAQLGTRFCIDKTNLQFPNGDSIYYPYILKIVELYTPKDMIYYDMFTNTSNGVYTGKSMVRVRTLKNDTELQLRNEGYFEVEMNDATAAENMSVYYSGTPSLWEQSTEEYTKTEYGYLGLISKLGWNAAGKEVLFEEPATISFTSETDNLETVRMYMYLPSSESIVEITNHKNIQAPIGQKVKIICMAMGKKGDLYSYQNTINILTGDTSVDVMMTKLTDAELTANLDAL